MNKIDIRNKKASFEYEFIEKFIAGMQLTGTEIKSVRQGKVSLVDSYCYFDEGELYVKGMNIAEYSHGTYSNHDPMRKRKLLLTGKELRKLEKKVQEKGLTIVVLRIFISENGYAKLEIALAKGKKTHDRREDIKQRETERMLDRYRKRN